jgi:hypothetical protein
MAPLLATASYPRFNLVSLFALMIFRSWPTIARRKKGPAWPTPNGIAANRDCAGPTQSDIDQQHGRRPLYVSSKVFARALIAMTAILTPLRLEYGEEYLCKPPYPENRFVVEAPPALVIGWIPRRWWPSKAWARHPQVRLSLVAFPLLFWSGNVRPPSPLHGMPGLETYVSLRDFRGILWLNSADLLCGPNQEPIRVQHTWSYSVGYTPMLRLLDWYSLGIDGGGNAVVHRQTNGVTIEWEFRFKIGKNADRATRLVTGRWAPFAVLRISYVLNANGDVRLEFSGTDIPSQDFYSDWIRTDALDTLGSSQTDIDAFLGAGNKRYRWTEAGPTQPGPIRVHKALEWQGRIRSV